MLNSRLPAIAILAVGLIAPANAQQATSPTASPCTLGALASETAGMPAHDIPVKRTLRYSMTGRIRPLLFWIGKDGVGQGEIVWRSDDKGTNAIELFVGTDPSRVPRRIDRWGYIVERAHADSGTRVSGLITASQESSLAEVSKAPDANQSRVAFKTIESAVDKGAACVATGPFETFYDPTARDVPAIVKQARNRLSKATPKSTTLPAEIRAGFFTAMWEMLQDTVIARRNGAAGLAKLKGRQVSYIYGSNVLDLKLTNVQSESSPVVPIPASTYPLHAEFLLTGRASGEKYKFELQYASTGNMAGVPVLIRYSPRWWLQVDLKLSSMEGAPPLSGSLESQFVERLSR